MNSNYIKYSVEESAKRIDEIILSSDVSYEEVNSLPSRDKLTFTNGFYVNCSALFVDIRKSSELPNIHKRPQLAKLFRTYISEVVAVINGNPKCAEINVVGDCVSGIFDTPYKSDIDSVFDRACMISPLIDIMNYKFKKNSIAEIEIGIGLAYGRALMIKAGYNGSGINEVVWMGDVVNEASNLASYGNRESYDKEIMMSNVFYQNLSEENKKYVKSNPYRSCYHSNAINANMSDWYEQNCK